MNASTTTPNAGQSSILVTGADLAAEAVEILHGYNIVYAGKAPSEQDIVALCRKHDPVGIIVRYGRINAQAMDAAPSLRVISKHGSGTDTIDKDSARSRGIDVVAAVGANATAVAEQALMLLLACAKSVIQLNARMHTGHWDKATHKSIELAGKTLGLVGLGAIGLRVAEMAAALGMRVIGFDPYARNIPAHILRVELESLWRESDAISLHCPLTPENRSLISAETLAQCKPGVILINTARGGLIDEGALVAAVRSGQVASAGLDSFAVEPMMPGHPFQGEKNIILTPHVGGVTVESYREMGVAAARNLLTVLAQKKSSVPKE